MLYKLKCWDSTADPIIIYTALTSLLQAFKGTNLVGLLTRQQKLLVLLTFYSALRPRSLKFYFFNIEVSFTKKEEGNRLKNCTKGKIE